IIRNAGHGAKSRQLSESPRPLAKGWELIVVHAEIAAKRKGRKQRDVGNRGVRPGEPLEAVEPSPDHMIIHKPEHFGRLLHKGPIVLTRQIEQHVLTSLNCNVK